MCPFPAFDIGDVAYKYFFPRPDFPVFQQIRIFSQPVFGIGCLGIIPRWSDQHSFPLEISKQSVSPYLDAGTLKLGLQQVIEFPRTQPWHFHTQGNSHRPYLFQFRFPIENPPFGLVDRLAADPKQSAAEREAQT